MLLGLSLLGPGCESEEERRVERPTEWRLVDVQPSNVLVIEVAVGSSSCNEFEGVTVEETAAEVEIRAVVGVDAGADICTDDLVIGREEIRLTDPLDDRELTGCMPPEPPARLAPADSCRAAAF
jgi:hypothetical protein